MIVGGASVLEAHVAAAETATATERVRAKAMAPHDVCGLEAEASAPARRAASASAVCAPDYLNAHACVCACAVSGLPAKVIAWRSAPGMQAGRGCTARDARSSQAKLLDDGCARTCCGEGEDAARTMRRRKQQRPRGQPPAAMVVACVDWIARTAQLDHCGTDALQSLEHNLALPSAPVSWPAADEAPAPVEAAASRLFLLLRSHSEAACCELAVSALEAEEAVGSPVQVESPHAPDRWGGMHRRRLSEQHGRRLQTKRQLRPRAVAVLLVVAAL